MGICDVFFNLELQSIDDKVGAIRGANSIDVWEHVPCKLFAEGMCNVACNESSNRGGDAKWAELGLVEWVFV